jgi:biotin carboxylase
MCSPDQVLIIDPHNQYGVLFVETIFRRFGLPSVCLYTNRRERGAYQQFTEQAHSEWVAASYELSAGRMDQLVAQLRAHHRIAAVIPFDELSVLPSTELASRLGLSWPQPRIMRLFRDKFALKQHLRSTAPKLRINASQLVRTCSEVVALRKQTPYRRFILKPNDGYGNQHIGLFAFDSAEAQIRAYLRRRKGCQIVMEEYVGGTEYFVNGQIDAAGNSRIIAIFEYLRGSANGRHNIDLETAQVPHGTQLFDTIANYAAEVMRATGLTRSPFHLELKVDELGPSLIEVAARLAGHGNAILSGELHGPQLDVIDWAAHYYLGTGSYDVQPLNWRTYNSQLVRYVHGVALRRERLYELHGIAEVEALPEFYKWVKKPVTGIRVQRTLDCLSMPWSLILRAPTYSQTSAAAGAVRHLIGWNRRVGRARRAALSLQLAMPKGLARLRQALMNTPLRRILSSSSV